MSGKLVIGSNNVVPKDVNLTIIGRSDYTATSDDEGKIFLGASAVVKADGSVEANISPSNSMAVSSGQSTDETTKNYECDASGAGFTLIITTALKEYNIVKIDATANVVTLQPDSGTINGAASIPLNTQWQGKTVFFNGTNWTAF